jgi:hypothetical protein
MIALFFFGLGSMILFSLATTMLTEFMPGQSSSGVAVSHRLLEASLHIELILIAYSAG